jgi:hypothetical protein
VQSFKINTDGLCDVILASSQFRFNLRQPKAKCLILQIQVDDTSRGAKGGAYTVRRMIDNSTGVQSG